MSKICVCGTGGGNTGLYNCITKMTTPSGFIMVDYRDADGNVNFIDTSVPINSAFVTAKLNHLDPTKRWYPVLKIKNMENLRGDPEFEVANDNSKFLTQNGIRNVKGWVGDVHPKYVDKVNSHGCSEMGLFYIGVGGEVQGAENIPGFLFPIKVSENSFIATYFYSQDKAVSKMMLDYQIDPSEDDGNLSFILQSEMDDYNLLGITGLNDANIVVVACGTSEVIIDVFKIYGTAFEKDKLKKLVALNFFGGLQGSGTPGSLYNVTDELEVAITSFSESTTIPGRYTIGFATQDAGDEIRFAPWKTGFWITENSCTEAS